MTHFRPNMRIWPSLSKRGGTVLNYDLHIIWVQLTAQSVSSQLYLVMLTELLMTDRQSCDL